MNSKISAIVVIVLIVGALFYVASKDKIYEPEGEENDVSESNSDPVVDKEKMAGNQARVAEIADDPSDAMPVIASKETEGNTLFVGAVYVPGSCIGVIPEVSLSSPDDDGIRIASVNLVSESYEGANCTASNTPVPFQVTLPVAQDAPVVFKLDGKVIKTDIKEK